jgi:hypothetical protein
MLTWPFDPKTAVLSNAQKTTKSYIRWASSPIAHYGVSPQNENVRFVQTRNVRFHVGLGHP